MAKRVSGDHFRSIFLYVLAGVSGCICAVGLIFGINMFRRSGFSLDVLEQTVNFHVTCDLDADMSGVADFGDSTGIVRFSVSSSGESFVFGLAEHGFSEMSMSYLDGDFSYQSESYCPSDGVCYVRTGMNDEGLGQWRSLEARPMPVSWPVFWRDGVFLSDTARRSLSGWSVECDPVITLSGLGLDSFVLSVLSDAEASVLQEAFETASVTAFFDKSGRMIRVEIDDYEASGTGWSVFLSGSLIFDDFDEVSVQDVTPPGNIVDYAEPFETDEQVFPDDTRAEMAEAEGD